MEQAEHGMPPKQIDRSMRKHRRPQEHTEVNGHASKYPHQESTLIRKEHETRDQNVIVLIGA